MKLYVVQEDFPGITTQLEAMLRPYLACKVIEWTLESQPPPGGLLLHCVVVDTRFDHIALPRRVLELRTRWGSHNYIFLRVHNQTGVSYGNDDINDLLTGVTVWKSMYKVAVNMGSNHGFYKEFIDSENIAVSIARRLKSK